MDSQYELQRKAPSLGDYLCLRTVTGFSPKTREQAEPIFDKTRQWIHVNDKDSGKIVAIGRVIGDGGWCLLITDMATDPDHQRQGIERVILDELLHDILTAAPENPNIVLLADAPGRPLYESMGFVETALHSIGMRYAPNESAPQY